MSNSKIVTSNQPDIHGDLAEILKRYQAVEYKRPIAEHSLKAMEEIKYWVYKNDNKELILDMGCGTGESSYNLARIYPDKLVIGIDKSLSRLERKNDFKTDLPLNVKLIRGELLDLWFLFFKEKENLNIFKQNIFYPNPWPKKKLVKRRFHANPIWPYLIKLAPCGELRTNWEIYAKEFQLASEQFGVSNLSLKEFIPKDFISNFETKYHNSGHNLYQLKWTLN